MLTFEESLDHHVYFVCETYNDYASLTRCRREGCRANLASHTPGYVPPCTVTQARLLEVMCELEDEEIRKKLDEWRIVIGQPFLGLATDALTKHRRHFVTWNGSVIVGDPLKFQSFVLEYHEYTGKGHAKALAADWREVDKKFGIRAADRGVPTADGASAQQAAIFELTGEPGRICISHQEVCAAYVRPR